MSFDNGKFIFFDLDGTLINTLKGITVALNNTLNYFNYPFTYEYDEVKNFLGHGARYLYMSATKKDFLDEDEYIYFSKEYSINQNLSEVFEGVIDGLKILQSKGFKLFIYSNKPDNLLQDICKEKLDEIKFVKIQGNIKEYPVKPDPTLLNKIINDYSLNKENGYYVGDSEVDLLLSRNCGLKSILVLFGFGNYETINLNDAYKTVNKFEEILEIV
ncbi:MAG: HAD family hydrolase [Bacillales bacterium]